MVKNVGFRIYFEGQPNTIQLSSVSPQNPSEEI